MWGRRESNPHWRRFKRPASADWATPPGTRFFCGPVIISRGDMGGRPAYRYAAFVRTSRLPNRSFIHRPSGRTSRSAVGFALLVAGVIALSAWQAQLSRDSAGAHWGVALVVRAVVSAIILGRRRQSRTTAAWIAGNIRAVRSWRSQPVGAVISTLVWTVVIAGVVGWDLVSFIYQSPALPTLSYFIGHVTRYRVGRGLFFALWLVVGVFLVSGWRTETPR